MKKALTAMLLAAAGLLPLAAQAQFSKVDDAVEYRKGAMFVMGQHFGRIGATVQGKRPYDKAAIEVDAATVEFMSKLPWHAFVPGSATPESKSKDEVWKEADKFKAAADKLMAEAPKLAAAAKTGDLAQIKTAFGATAQSCKGCHDSYRMK